MVMEYKLLIYCLSLDNSLKGSNGLIVGIYCGAHVSDIEFNIITHKDSNSSPLPTWSIPARNGIIRNIKRKITFQPRFITSEDVNIILFQKERYFHLFIFAAAYIYVCQFKFRGLKRRS